MIPAFKLENTVKQYRGFKLGPLNLELQPGTVLGYVGPNGSGKTTTFHCMMGLVKTDGGEVEIFGQTNNPDKPAWKLDIGYVGDTQVFYENWSGGKNLRFLSQFYPDWSNNYAAELAKRFDLPLEKKAKTLSRGNRVKLSLVSALAHSPKLLLFDEPTLGLDPVVKAELLDVLFEILEDGNRSIFYSTHILTEISRIADEIAFLNDGQVFKRTTKEELLEKWRKITFKMPNKNIKVDAEASCQTIGENHQIISSDFEVSINHLKNLNAENIQENRMTFDEIAVQIIKGEKYVEAGKN